jgi:exodeoxyribonuclease VII small subunit
MSEEKIEDPKAFEAALQDLEAIVDRLERGDLTLQESLAAFEQGIRLSHGCQQALDQAEQRIRILTEQSVDAEPEAFPNQPFSEQPPSEH